jgi:hypothetical protein
MQLHQLLAPLQALLLRAQARSAGEQVLGLRQGSRLQGLLAVAASGATQQGSRQRVVGEQ